MLELLALAPMVKPRAVILGEKPQGAAWLQTILASNLFTVVAGVTREQGKRWWGSDTFASTLHEHGIPLVRREELSAYAYDILFSFVYPFIIEPEHLERARWYAVNLHESPLPRYRGCNGYSHAIFDGATTYGTSLHTMAAELDAGELIDQEVFPIAPNETAKELYMRTTNVSTTLLQRNLARLASGSIPHRPLDVRTEPLHTRSSLEGLKRIPEDRWNDRTYLWRAARACDFLPFEPAYAVLNGHKHYLFIDESLGRSSYSTAAETIQDLAVLPGFPRPIIFMREARYQSLYPI